MAIPQSYDMFQWELNLSPRKVEAKGMQWSHGLEHQAI